MAWLVRSNLRWWVLLIALLSALVPVINLFLTSSELQKQALIKHSLESNEAYAIKIATSADSLLRNAQSELAYAAEQIGPQWHDSRYVDALIQRLAVQNNNFNSVALIQANGLVIESSDNIQSLVGQVLHNPSTKQALTYHEAYITQPYTSPLHNLIVSLIQPVFDQKGRYMGFISGSIYLNEENVLSQILGKHFAGDEAFVCVIDPLNRYLYHPESEEVGRFSQAIYKDIKLEEQSGSVITQANHQQDMLMGYAYMYTTNWLILSQSSLQTTLKAHEGLMTQVLIKSLPLNILVIALIWVLSWWVANPLRQLAVLARHIDKSGTIRRVKYVKAWYFEANELKRALLSGLQATHERIGQLRHDTQIDMLTQLNNRRALASILDGLQRHKTSFTALALDIDHFKRVNDTYGHAAGDLVLKELADILKQNTRSADHCIRLGGEEFLILLPKTPFDAAGVFAQRLCDTVAAHDFTQVGRVTISIGVAHWPNHHPDPQTVLQKADEALYAAKQGGRNQVQFASGPS